LIIYSNQIKSLSLSEYLPNSINLFLSIFPIFDQFENLFELNLDFDGTHFEKEILFYLFKSLSKTNINTQWRNRDFRPMGELLICRKETMAKDWQAFYWWARNF